MGRVAIISADALRSKGPRPSVALDRPSPNMPAQGWSLGEIEKESARATGWSMHLHHARDGMDLTKRISFQDATRGRPRTPTVSFNEIAAGCCGDYRFKGLSAA